MTTTKIKFDDGSVVALADHSDAAIGESNLSRRKHDGTLCWKAPLTNPQTGHYLSCRREGSVLIANSFDGFVVTIDPQTGAIISREFTK